MRRVLLRICRVLLRIFGGLLMFSGFSLIMAANLQAVENFQTLPHLFIFICGSCVLNFELFVFQKEKTHILALLSFVFALTDFSIFGAPISLGVLTRPLAWFFALASSIFGVSFVIMNKRKANALRGNSAAFTGISISMALLLVLSVPFFYNPQKHYDQGMDYYYAGKYDQAIKEYDEAIKEEPQFIDAYYRRGLAYAKKGNYEDAISDYNRKIQSFFRSDPSNAEVYLARAEAYFYKHEYDKAWEDVYKAQALNYQVDLEFLQKLRRASGRDR